MNMPVCSAEVSHSSQLRIQSLTSFIAAPCPVTAAGATGLAVFVLLRRAATTVMQAVSCFTCLINFTCGTRSTTGNEFSLAMTDPLVGVRQTAQNLA